jgi:hypothetical protein
MSFWNPFRRKQPNAPDDQRQMSEDWAPGDLAECIKDNWPFVLGVFFHPKKGDVLRVTEVNEGVDCVFGRLIIALSFEKMGDACWDNRCFRKLRPEIESAEQSWTEWFKDKLRQPEVVQ